MANQTFIELTVDAFDTQFRQQSGDKQPTRLGAGLTSVRRPLRGIEIKDDTYAVIRVIRATGEEVQLVSSSAKGGHSRGYTNFLLQNVINVDGGDPVNYLMEVGRLLILEIMEKR